MLNQVTLSLLFKRFCLIFSLWKLQDQKHAIEMIQNDPELACLTLVQAPLVDVEIRGVPALKFLGDMVWRWNFRF